jgi:hypothetical protein
VSDVGDEEVMEGAVGFGFMGCGADLSEQVGVHEDEDVD